ncbi:MAG: hypothetical protein M3O34_15200 [Chloroflexota bacterium]|nr:hypothetical protein [Chloroflexota bacterium]
MNAMDVKATTDPVTEGREIRRQVADEVYRKLALLSAAIWTLGTLLYFIVVAAPAARPVFPAMEGMIGSLVLAAIPWLFRRQVTDWLVARRLHDRARGA